MTTFNAIARTPPRQRSSLCGNASERATMEPSELEVRHGESLGVSNGICRHSAVALSVAVVIAAVAIFAGSGCTASLQSTDASRRAEMMQVALAALKNEAESENQLPSSVHRDALGKPLSSWRFLVLRWLLGERTHDFDRYWFDPVYYQAACAPSPFYCLAGQRPEGSLDTNIVAIVGPGTAFDGSDCSLQDLDKDTILLIEVAKSGVHWMEPGDLDVRRVPATIAQGIDGSGVHVGFADGEVWFLERDVPVDDLRVFFSVEGAKQSDREDVLGEYCIRRSHLSPYRRH